MKILNCPITGEKILTIGAKGVMKRENYAEVLFSLADGSKMRVAMSKDAKKTLTQKSADKLIQKIKGEFTEVIESKDIPIEEKTKQLERITKIDYTKIEDKKGLIINIKQKNVS